MKNKIIFFLLICLAFSCKSPEARKPVSQKTGSYIDAAVERNKKIVAAEEKQIQEIIEEDSRNNYITSTHGFWYFYNDRDTSLALKPKFGDLVEFKYDIKTLNDEVIYPEEERIYRMDQEELFAGLREGLKLMHEGETVTFLFPSHKAFGFYGDKGKIGTDIPIKSTVTLINITPKDSIQINVQNKK